MTSITHSQQQSLLAHSRKLTESKLLIKKMKVI